MAWFSNDSERWILGWCSIKIFQIFLVCLKKLQQGGGDLFFLLISRFYKKYNTIFLSKSIGLKLIGTNLPLMTHYPNCSYCFNLLINMAAMESGLFSLHVYIIKTLTMFMDKSTSLICKCFGKLFSGWQWTKIHVELFW